MAILAVTWETAASLVDPNSPNVGVQVFNDMSIRMLLGEEVYFSPFGSIDASHVVGAHYGNVFTRNV